MLNKVQTEKYVEEKPTSRNKTKKKTHHKQSA